MVFQMNKFYCNFVLMKMIIQVILWKDFKWLGNFNFYWKCIFIYNFLGIVIVYMCSIDFTWFLKNQIRKELQW